MPNDLIRLLEEISLNALPALQTVVYDGWLLRFANGYTGRANSAQTLYPGARPLGEKIGYCEESYRARGLKPLFKLTHASLPPGLDTELASRGYTVRDTVSVQTLPLAHTDVPDSLIQIDSRPSDSWLSALLRLRRLGPEWEETVYNVFRQIVPARAFSARVVEGEVVAIGLGVVERGWLGVFSVATDEAQRRQGHATAMMNGLRAWGREQGAVNVYLQVTKTNHTALEFYKKLGFREAYTYWYRAKADS